MTVSLRLDELLAKRLEVAAKARGISKSELIRQCLDDYLSNGDQQPSVWEQGKHLFGRHGSGRSDLSEKCEDILRERFRAKASRH